MKGQFHLHIYKLKISSANDVCTLMTASLTSAVIGRIVTCGNRRDFKNGNMQTRGVHTRPEPDTNPTRKSGSFGLTCDYVRSGRVRVQTLIFGLRSGLKS